MSSCFTAVLPPGGAAAQRDSCNCHQLNQSHLGRCKRPHQRRYQRSCNTAGTATLSVFFQALLSLGFEPRLVFFARSGTGSQTFKTLDVALTFSWRQQEDSCLIPVLLTVTCTLLRKITSLQTFQNKVLKSDSLLTCQCVSFTEILSTVVTVKLLQVLQCYCVFCV